MNDTIDTAQKFWTRIAQPDYADFLNATDDLRKAFHAAASLCHVVDWVWGDYKNSSENVYGASCLQDFRSYIVQNECADLGLIRDVADSAKHFRLDWRPATITSATEVTSRTTGFGEGRFGEGPFGGGQSVVLESATGIRHFTTIVRNVHEMWERLFLENGW